LLPRPRQRIEIAVELIEAVGDLVRRGMQSSPHCLIGHFRELASFGSNGHRLDDCLPASEPVAPIIQVNWLGSGGRGLLRKVFGLIGANAGIVHGSSP
jgi:hypothetical protein